MWHTDRKFTVVTTGNYACLSTLSVVKQAN